jgi:hypothetical protein
MAPSFFTDGLEPGGGPNGGVSALAAPPSASAANMTNLNVCPVMSVISSRTILHCGAPIQLGAGSIF